MADLLFDGPETLSMLYGESFYIIPQDAVVATDVPLTIPPLVSEAMQVVAEVKIVPPIPETKLDLVKEAVSEAPAIIWKPKPKSVVLFVLQITEFKNPELTDLLKKIVDSLGIAAELVGFGQIDGRVRLEEFDTMPNPYAVVFDPDIWGGKENPVKLGKGEVFFTQRLAQLQNDQDLKRVLWVHLKKLKDRIS